MAHPAIARLRQLQARAQEWLDERQLLDQDEAQLSRGQKIAQFVILVVRHFIRNRCPGRAGALSYTTILALIPMLAVGIGVASSLLKQKGEVANEELFQRLIDNFVSKAAPQLGLVPRAPGEENDAQREVVRRIAQFISNIQSGTIGSLGVIALVLVAISLLTTIESTFNDMWGITRGRRWTSRIVQYWTAITLGPLLLALALTLSTGPHFNATRLWVEKMPYFSTLVFSFTPFLVVSLAFMIFYLFLPNTRVHWRAALVGGVVGGCLWQLNNVLSFLFVSRIVTYREIYKSFAILPVFMFGLYVSWIIVLFGAQVAYVFQNWRAYVQEKLAESVNQRGREFVAVRLMTLIAQRFHQGQKAPTVLEMAEALGVSSRLISQISCLLVDTRLLQEVKGGEAAFVPARPLETISVYSIIESLRAGQGREPATKEDPARPIVRTEFDRLSEAERRVGEAATLAELVRQVERSARTLGP